MYQEYQLKKNDFISFPNDCLLFKLDNSANPIERIDTKTQKHIIKEE